MAVVQLLPDELIVEILSILPAKSLLRCQLVCKSWLNLISSTKFKLMHVRNFNQRNPRYFLRRFDYSSSKQWFCVHFDDDAFTFDPSAQFSFYICNGVNLWFKVVGCCNGLVCLYDGGYRSSSDRVILWNPSIRRKLTLPRFYYINSPFVVLGFGYHKLSDDYKLVRLTYNDYGFTRPHVEVYAMKTGIWREVMLPDDLCCVFIHYNRSQIFTNGCVHWIASDRTYGDSHNSILTFDITSELFGEILLPDDLVKVELSTMMISVVGESLVVTYYNYLINPTSLVGATSSTYKIWVMKEYKNPTSWTLIFNMHYPDRDMGKPLKLRNKGDMIMESWDGNTTVYNYNGGYAFSICPGYESDMHCWTYVDKYQESLALLDVGHSVSNVEGFDDDRIAKA